MMVIGCSAELKFNVACSQHVACKTTHPVDQRVEAISPRTDRPHDLTHGIYQVTRKISDVVQHLARLGAIAARSSLDDFAQYRNLRESGPTVVVQDARGAGADARNTQLLRAAIQVRL